MDKAKARANVIGGHLVQRLPPNVGVSSEGAELLDSVPALSTGAKIGLGVGAVAAYRAYSWYQRNHIGYFIKLSQIMKKVNAFVDSNAMIADMYADRMRECGPKRTCMVDLDASGKMTNFSFADINAIANRIADWAMKLGLKRGDTVAVILTNRPEYFAIWLGLSKIGVVAALINTNLKGKGLRHCIDISSAAHIIVGTDQVEEVSSDLAGLGTIHTFGPGGAQFSAYESLSDKLASLSPKEPPKATRKNHKSTDPLMYIYTSGTTGLPKAAVITHMRFYLMAALTLNLDASPADRVYCCLPLYHSAGGVIGVGSIIWFGTTLIVTKKFSATRFFQECAISNATIAQYIGELLRYLVASPPSKWDRAHKLRGAIGNGLRPDIWQAVLDRFGKDLQICEFYGATEGNIGLANPGFRVGAIGYIPPFLLPYVPGQIVKFDIESEEPIRDPKTGLCIRVNADEPGELLGKIMNDNITKFSGYVGKGGGDKANSKKVLTDVFEKGDMYFRTGDLLRHDADGFYYFVDRIGDTFRWKGENVSTNEVAEAINVFAGLQETNVYGVPIAGTDGKAGMAAIVLANGKGVETVDMKKLYAHVEQQLPVYARPIFLRFRPEVEVTGTLKHRKVELVRDGFDPAKLPAGESLYAISPKDKTYIPLTAEVHADILAGKIRY